MRLRKKNESVNLFVVISISLGWEEIFHKVGWDHVLLGIPNCAAVLDFCFLLRQDVLSKADFGTG